VQPTLKALREKYGDKLRLVWKHDPPSFHAAAGEAAEAALEVRAEKGDAAFWDAHDRFFEHQRELANDGKPDIARIVKLATEAGGNGDKVAKAIAQRVHEEDIEADLDLGEDLDSKGTLHFFINGRRLDGAQPQATFEKMIDEELAKAQKLVAQGVLAKDVYDTLIKDGRGPFPPEMKDVPKSLPATDPSRGNPKAEVTVHVWSDYQCPLCNAVERTMDRLLTKHDKHVRFVWHDLPLARHADARIVARAGREAYAQQGAAGFWAMHEKIAIVPHRVTRDDLDAFAKTMKLDSTKWRSALDDGAGAAEIAADEKAAADAGITETPAYLVVRGGETRGYFVSATQESERLHRLVERALDEGEH
jgi:protein-disulfide isomerase